jgi:hypothetical protein
MMLSIWDNYEFIYNLRFWIWDFIGVKVCEHYNQPYYLNTQKPFDGWANSFQKNSLLHSYAH